MNDKKRAYAVKFDSFNSNGKKFTLWIMPSGGMQILIEKNNALIENITLNNANLTPEQMIRKYRKLALDEGRKDVITQINTFGNSEKTVSLWMASSDNSLHIIISNMIVDDFISSRDPHIDESRLALLFQEIKSDMTGEAPISESIDDIEQIELFAEAA